MPSKVLVVIVAACLIWIGLISLAIVLVSGASISVGWIIAGVLALAGVVWGLVMMREIRDAIKLPDTSAFGNRAEEEFDSKGNSTVARPRFGTGGRIFTGRRTIILDRIQKVRPRKLRSSAVEFAKSPTPR